MLQVFVLDKETAADLMEGLVGEAMIRFDGFFFLYVPEYFC